LIGKHSSDPGLFPVVDDEDDVRAVGEKARRPKLPQDDHVAPNLGKPVKISVPNFGDPNRPKT